jgi:hypothetical protein
MPENPSASGSRPSAEGQNANTTGGNDLLALVQIAWKHRRFILLITGLVAVASVLYTVFAMPNYYKSSVTFYPSNPTMTDRSVMFGESVSDMQIDYFGGNSDIDRILTLAQTSGTIDYIINRYQLFEHYDYDTAATMGRYKTRKKFLKNYNARKTVLGAVEISIWDVDKFQAADIANHIALTVDNKNREMLNKERLSIIETLADRMADKQHLVDSLGKRLQNTDVLALQSSLLRSELDYAIEDLNDTRRLHEQYATSVNLGVSTINITEPAYPALRKDKPVRSLLCAGYTVAAFLASLIWVVLLEQFRRIKPTLNHA